MLSADKLHVLIISKVRILNHLEPSGPVHGCAGNALHLHNFGSRTRFPTDSGHKEFFFFSYRNLLGFQSVRLEAIDLCSSKIYSHLFTCSLLHNAVSYSNYTTSSFTKLVNNEMRNNIEGSGPGSF